MKQKNCTPLPHVFKIRDTNGGNTANPYSTHEDMEAEANPYATHEFSESPNRYYIKVLSSNKLTHQQYCDQETIWVEQKLLTYSFTDEQRLKRILMYQGA